MDPADTETRVEDTKHSLFRKERGVWGRERGKPVKNDEQVIPGTQGAQGNGADLSREEARVHPQSPVNHLLVEGVHSLCVVF